MGPTGGGGGLFCPRNQLEACEWGPLILGAEGSPMPQLPTFAASGFGMLVPSGTHFAPVARLAVGGALR